MLLGEDRAGAELSWNQMLQDMDANNDMEIARDGESPSTSHDADADCAA